MEATGFRKKFNPGRSLLLCGLIGSLFWLTGCANGIFYQPSRRMAPAPDQRGLRYEPLRFQSSDGVTLHGWWLPAEGETKGTVLHFHGNAENMSTHVQFADWLPAAGYHLMVFDYRGYGASEGRPTRTGLIRDGLAALEVAGRRADAEDTPLFVWGQSLGGTVALQSMMRSGVKVNAALIDSTFSSHGRIAADKMKQFPWFLQPLRLFRPLFVSSSYDARDAVVRLQELPLLFIHGEEDRVIPPSHSRKLQRLAPGHSQLWIIPQAGHCSAVLRFPEQVRPVILRFFENNSPKP